MMAVATSCCHHWLDPTSRPALRARRLAEAEASGDRERLAAANWEAFYGDLEQEEAGRRVWEGEEEGGWWEVATMLLDLLQQEYLLQHYRRQQQRAGRQRRDAPSLGGLLDRKVWAAPEPEPEPEFQPDGHVPYYAEVAYFFPLLTFWIPFNGTVEFFQNYRHEFFKGLIDY